MLNAIIYLAALGAFYALVYYLNHRTPRPQGCEEIDATCGTCSLGHCGNHPSQQFTEVKLTLKEKNNA